MLLPDVFRKWVKHNIALEIKIGQEFMEKHLIYFV